MPVTQRKSDADLSESVRHDADAGPVIMPGYTVLRKEDWERLLGVVQRATHRDFMDVPHHGDQQRGELNAMVAIEPAKLMIVQLKLARLPGSRLAEIEDFVDFIRQREEQSAKNWQTTVEAMEAARRGETKSFESTEALMDWLHADEDADA